MSNSGSLAVVVTDGNSFMRPFIVHHKIQTLHGPSANHQKLTPATWYSVTSDCFPQLSIRDNIWWCLLVDLTAGRSDCRCRTRRRHSKKATLSACCLEVFKRQVMNSFIPPTTDWGTAGFPHETLGPVNIEVNSTGNCDKICFNY